MKSILDEWQHLAAWPQTLNFPTMTLLCRDWEEPLIVGRGTVTAIDPFSFEFKIQGTPTEPRYTAQQLQRQKEDPYQPLLRFRLIATDETGREFACGWTVPEVQHNRKTNEWTFSGQCDGLMFDVDDPRKDRVSGTEVRYIIPNAHQAAIFLRHLVRSQDACGRIVPEYHLSVLGETVTFRYDASAETLSVRVPSSETFPLTLTENRLGEPLRILFGQLIYPRMIARAFKEPRVMITVSQTRKWSNASNWAALWNGPASLQDHRGFWTLTADLLAYIVSAKDASGQTTLEANKITQLYVEVIQASYGTRWVWALTFGSSIEGLLRILAPRGSLLEKEEVDHAAIESLAGHIAQWKGSERFKSTAIGAVRRLAELTPKRVLLRLIASGQATKAQLEAWETVRNSVVHGDLRSPYSTKEDDDRLLELSALMHTLTRVILERFKSSGVNPASPKKLMF